MTSGNRETVWGMSPLYQPRPLNCISVAGHAVGTHGYWLLQFYPGADLLKVIAITI